MKPITFEWNQSLPTTMNQEYLNKQHESIAFGFHDSKGRELGISISTYDVEFVPFTPGPYDSAYRIPAGHYYVAWIQSTRGGNCFGASQSNNYFHTAEDRAAWIEAQKISRRKAAAKRIG